MNSIKTYGFFLTIYKTVPHDKLKTDSCFFTKNETRIHTYLLLSHKKKALINTPLILRPSSLKLILEGYWDFSQTAVALSLVISSSIGMLVFSLKMATFVYAHIIP